MFTYREVVYLSYDEEEEVDANPNQPSRGETTQLIVVLHEEVRVPDVHTVQNGCEKRLLFEPTSFSVVFICIFISSVFDNTASP